MRKTTEREKKKEKKSGTARQTQRVRHTESQRDRQQDRGRLTSADDADEQDGGNGEVANQYTIRENSQSSHGQRQSDTEQLHTNTYKSPEI